MKGVEHLDFKLTGGGPESGWGGCSFERPLESLGYIELVSGVVLNLVQQTFKPQKSSASVFYLRPYERKVGAPLVEWGDVWISAQSCGVLAEAGPSEDTPNWTWRRQDDDRRCSTSSQRQDIMGNAPRSLPTDSQVTFSTLEGEGR